MYDYRELSEQEKDKILEIRNKRDFPLHAPPHTREGFEKYHISAACYEHKNIFQQPEDLTYVMKEVLDISEENEVSCIAWVFLPDHYHLLVETDNIDKFGEILRLAHSETATYMNKKAEEKGRKVWYRYSDRGIRNNDHYWSTINYIHNNPVKDGYVDSISDWPWSSFDRFQDEFGLNKMRKIWNAHPIDGFEKGWDGE